MSFGLQYKIHKQTLQCRILGYKPNFVSMSFDSRPNYNIKFINLAQVFRQILW
jgi:hypothetical protein